MTNSIGNILRSLNESVDINNGTDLALDPNKETPDGGKVRVPESDDTTKFHCDKCDKDFNVNEGEDPVCPDCGEEGVPSGKLVEFDEIEDEPTIEEECEDMLDEALSLLSVNDYKKFNEKYSAITRMTSKGKLQVMVESASTGKTYVSTPRRLTARQKAAYRMAESYKSTFTSHDRPSSSKFEAIQAKRLALVARNESRMTKIACRKVLERMGVKFNIRKFNEAVDAEIKSREDDLTKKIEDIVEDEPTVITTLEEMDPDQLKESIKSVFESTGLDVLSSEYYKDGNSDVVDLRVEDSPNVEVYTDEIKEVLEDALSSEVDIVGPVPATEGSDIKDMSVIINPDKETNESDNLEDEEDPNNTENPISSELNNVDECDDSDPIEKKIKESIRNRRNRRNRRMGESDNSSTEVNKKMSSESEDNQLYALKATESTDDDPEFLTNDDSVVKGNSELSESYARFFVNKNAAQRFVDVRGMSDRFTPVSVSIKKR